MYIFEMIKLFKKILRTNKFVKKKQETIGIWKNLEFWKTHKKIMMKTNLTIYVADVKIDYRVSFIILYQCISGLLDCYLSC